MRSRNVIVLVSAFSIVDVIRSRNTTLLIPVFSTIYIMLLSNAANPAAGRLFGNGELVFHSIVWARRVGNF